MALWRPITSPAAHPSPGLAGRAIVRLPMRPRTQSGPGLQVSAKVLSSCALTVDNPPAAVFGSTNVHAGPAPAEHNELARD